MHYILEESRYANIVYIGVYLILKDYQKDIQKDYFQWYATLQSIFASL